MGIKTKFLLLAALVSIILGAVSIIGYTTAHSNLRDSIEKEMLAATDAQGRALEGWINEKSANGIAAANLMARFSNGSLDHSTMQSMMQLADNDRDIMAITNCDETGVVVSNTADYTGKLEIRTRDWYKRVKAEGSLIYTDVYKDATNGKLVVSAAAPYSINNQFRGAVCVDIDIDTLDKVASTINYRGEGKGMIIASNGIIIASADPNDAMSNVSDTPLRDHFQQMITQPQGFFEIDDQNVFAYATVNGPDWIVGMLVPGELVFASVDHLRFVYFALTIATIVGVFLTVGFSLAFSTRIINYITDIRNHTNELSHGNFRVPELKVDSNDEFGDLARAFNKMMLDIKSLVKQVARNAELVAASSEQLTAGAQHSADASTNIAETAAKVSSDMENQLQSIDDAKRDVGAVHSDVTMILEKSRRVAENTIQTADAAQAGADLMHKAVEQMEHIEHSVTDTAAMVEKLGHNSQQIGQIVETIAAIADQTNLLALNAAIEAARAGEQGKGFAVVAGEVRKLATSSQEAVEQIKDRIANILADTQRAVEAMEGGTDRVKAGANSIRQVGDQFAKIIEMVRVNKNEMNDINISMQEVYIGASYMVKLIEAIDLVSRETNDNTQAIGALTQEQSASTEEIAAASRSLADVASILQSETGKFNI